MGAGFPAITAIGSVREILGDRINSVTVDLFEPAIIFIFPRGFWLWISGCLFNAD